jgi:hypothetical protein
LELVAGQDFGNMVMGGSPLHFSPTGRELAKAVPPTNPISDSDPTQRRSSWYFPAFTAAHHAGLPFCRRAGPLVFLRRAHDLLSRRHDAGIAQTVAYAQFSPEQAYDLR